MAATADDLTMNSSLYVLHNQGTAQDYRHETLDAALDAPNTEVGERECRNRCEWRRPVDRRAS